MKKTAQAVQSVEPTVHPLHKSYMLISSKHVDYENITAFEAVSMSLALVLSVTIGVLQSGVAV
jgi:hypothetical protein